MALVPWLLFCLFLFRSWQTAPPQDPDAFYYLLSALSQGLAAVLAFTFTISLVAAQLTVRYGYGLLQRLLTPVTVAYMLFFILALLMPLTLLPTPTIFQVKLSLALGALALVLLVPYFRYFLVRISIRCFLEDLTRDVERSLRTVPNGLWKKTGSVDFIQNIALNAFGSRDYETFSLALQKLGLLAQVADEQTKRSRTAWTMVTNISDRIKNVALISGDDAWAQQICGREVGARLLLWRPHGGHLVYQGVQVLMEIANLAIHKQREDSLLVVVDKLLVLGMDATEAKAHDIARYVANTLRGIKKTQMGATVMERAVLEHRRHGLYQLETYRKLVDLFLKEYPGIAQAAEQVPVRAPGIASIWSSEGDITDLWPPFETEIPTPDESAGVTFPHGFLSFRIVNIAQAKVTVTLMLPSEMPFGTEYWTYEPSKGWLLVPVGHDDGDDVITIELADGGLGDTSTTPRWHDTSQGGSMLPIAISAAAKTGHIGR